MLNLKDGTSIKAGDIVYYISNTGISGIYHYQYMGIVNDAFSKNKYHLFLSEYMVSTITINIDRVDTSIGHKKIFLTKEEAEKEVTKLREKNNK